MKRLIRSNLGWLFWAILLSLLVVFPLMNSIVKAPIEETQGNISFMPNVIPQTSVSFNSSRFVFDWLGNHFEVAMFLVGEDFEYELEVEADKIKLKVKAGDVEFEEEVEGNIVVDKFMSNVTWGLLIPDVPEIISNYTDAFSFKIKNANFNVSKIEVEKIESFADLGYNITRLHLPDNLVLSYEDLWLYNFTVLHPNKFEAKVEGVKGKSSWNLDPITFSSPTITVTGFTEGMPCTFWDLWNASNANGWNVANKTSSSENYQFDFGGRIVIGDSSTATWFADTEVQVYFNSTSVSANAQILMQVTANANFRIGQLDDSTNKLTSKGVSLFVENSYNFIYIVDGLNSLTSVIYSSSLKAETNRHNLRVRVIYNSIFYNVMVMGVSTSGDINQMINTGSDFGLYMTGLQPFGDLDNILVYRTTYGFYPFAVGPTRDVILRNPIFRNITTYELYVNQMSGNVTLINANFDQWRFYWNAIGEVYRQYELDLNVTDSANSPIENANVTVTHYGQGKTQDFSILTGSNGSFATQTLTMGFYNQTGANTIYDYNPYNITITHDNYATKTFNFTLQEEIKWLITLDTSSYSIGIGGGFILGALIIGVLGLAGLFKFKKRG